MKTFAMNPMMNMNMMLYCITAFLVAAARVEAFGSMPALQLATLPPMQSRRVANYGTGSRVSLRMIVPGDQETGFRQS
jgi:hypothetical protein